MTIEVGDRVVVEKGCRTLDISKGVTAIVTEVKLLGAEYSHFVQVNLKFVNGFKAGKTVVLNARHINRLSDLTTNLSDGWGRGKLVVRLSKKATKPVCEVSSQS
jgi:hypothetical protein